MAATKPQLDRFALARDDLIDSVDTVAFVQKISRRPDEEELIKRGFSITPGKHHNSSTFYLNHEKEDSLTLPNISIYEEFGAGYGVRANICIPKFLHGQNIELVNGDDIFDALQGISEYVSDLSGIEFDATTARVARIDYATNLYFGREVAERFLQRSKRLIVPWMPFMPKQSIGDSAYHGNQSRTIKTYDKCAEAGIGHANGVVVRGEYALLNETAVKRYAERIGAADHRAETMLSQGVRKVAIDELFKSLQLHSFDPEADFSLEYFYKKSGGNLSKARRCSSFVAMYKLFGANLFLNPELKMSREKYRLELRECQELGF